MSFVIRVGVIVLALALLGRGSLGGDLNPPAGAIQPTDRVVLNAQVITLPHTINRPGSYVLTSNFLAPGAVDGFTIDANNVTLDLNGFSVMGVPGSGNGILVIGGRRNVVIKNGQVSGWGGVGVVNNANETRLEHLVSSDNGGVGIAGGAGGAIRWCPSVGNGGTGIVTSVNSLVESCVAQGNTGDGIESPRNGVVRHCVSRFNSLTGIRATESTIVEGCGVSSNGDDGVQALDGCVVVNCVALGNTGSGFAVGRRSVISDCTARANGEFGISLEAPDGTARRCVSSQNQLSGIRASAHCTVIENVCHANSQAGIAISAGSNRIEGNTVAGSPAGILTLLVTAVDNVILANRATANGANYSIMAGNAFGPIVGVVGAGALSFVPGAEHPYANFEY